MNEPKKKEPVVQFHFNVTVHRVEIWLLLALTGLITFFWLKNNGL